MKKKNTRNLPPVWFEIPGDDNHQPTILQFSQDAERRRHGTPWFLTKSRYFRIAVAFAGHKPHYPEGELPLTRRYVEVGLQELANLIKTTIEKVPGEDAPI